ncbi:MAG: O-antigen ligase family protein [Syntrophales bacterium]
MRFLSNLTDPACLNNLAFYALLGSGAYLVLLWSPHVLGDYCCLTVEILIYTVPWLLVCLACRSRVVTAKEYRLEIILVISILLLGVLNAFLSDNPVRSVKTMRTFLLTGVLALWSSMFLVTGQRRREGFDWFCGGCLAVITGAEIITYIIRGAYAPGVFQIFTLHAIPLGTLIILLSTGPVRLILSKNSAGKSVGWLLVLAGGILVFLTHKRGTLIVLAAMLVASLIYHGRRLARRQRYLIFAMLLVIALVIPLQAKRMIARLDPNVPRYGSLYQRLELYPFAFHVWKTHPLMGIGLRPYTHDLYLKDYQQRNKDLREFPQAVAKLQTFDSMALTALVELGTVMTLLYLSLILLIIIRYVRAVRSLEVSSLMDWYRLLVLIGFACHSLTYDSLLFPPVNWLFHVQLGVMAGYYLRRDAYLRHSPPV